MSGDDRKSKLSGLGTTAALVPRAGMATATSDEDGKSWISGYQQHGIRYQSGLGIKVGQERRREAATGNPGIRAIGSWAWVHMAA